MQTLGRHVSGPYAHVHACYLLCMLPRHVLALHALLIITSSDRSQRRPSLWSSMRRSQSSIGSDINATHSSQSVLQTEAPMGVVRNFQTPTSDLPPTSTPIDTEWQFTYCSAPSPVLQMQYSNYIIIMTSRTTPTCVNIRWPTSTTPPRPPHMRPSTRKTEKAHMS